MRHPCSVMALLGLTVTLAACGATREPQATPTAPGGSAAIAPLLAADSPHAIPGQYIVVLKKDAVNLGGVSASSAGQLVRTLGLNAAGVSIQNVYAAALSGFAAELSAENLELLRHDPRVAYIEADQRVTASTTQSNATWGLDRIDQRNLPLNGSYSYTPTGAGVNAYIIDSGILTGHTQFGGRATAAFDAIGDGRGGQDCNGHGTHVAGTVGGSTHGVAKNVALHAVRVLDCNGSGSNSGVIAGVDWVTRNARKPAVANMSLGGPASSALDTAVNNSINAGITYAVAAGNENQNACNVSPARLANAITVGATTSSDARASFSNHGSCLDLFAPGNAITSAWIGSTTATSTINGTSMASPHVAGAAALYLESNPAASPASVTSALLNGATSGVLSSVGSGSPNKLLYSAPAVTSTPTTPCSSCETYTGSLSGSGDNDYQPGGTYFRSGGGSFKGHLRGPGSADFDLYLLKWNGSRWSTVARGESSTSSEDVTYSGTSGYYVWEIRSYAGSGPYTFYMNRP